MAEADTLSAKVTLIPTSVDESRERGCTIGKNMFGAKICENRQIRSGKGWDQLREYRGGTLHCEPRYPVIGVFLLPETSGGKSTIRLS
jgi:hypothetical protein